MSLKSSFVSYLHQKHPQLSVSLLDALISEELLSPFQVIISKKQVDSLKNEITTYWHLRNWGVKNLTTQFATYGLRRPDNYSVCMSYDFHINSSGQPELIEVNTNASFLALGLELYHFLNLPNPAGTFNETSLVEMFLNEIELCKIESRAYTKIKTNAIAIVDENPEQQRLYLEFLIYKSIFEKHGLAADVFNITEINKFKDFALVYNRYTDFYLQEGKSAEIKRLFNEGHINLSPQPCEYFLLGDKQRFLDWNQQSEIEKPLSLLKTYDLGAEDKDKIWTERKNLFFKPKTSFGGKQVYRGASISQKMFSDIFNQNFIAQQLSIPSLVSVVMNEKKQDFKYDLRCFVYKNELQLIVARLYQGQTTNLKNYGGGFACVTAT